MLLNLLTLLLGLLGFLEVQLLLLLGLLLGLLNLLLCLQLLLQLGFVVVAIGGEPASVTEVRQVSGPVYQAHGPRRRNGFRVVGLDSVE